MALISVGIDHEHASLDLLERASVPEHEWSKVLRTLLSQRNIHEAVFVSTCLRTEVVAVIDRFHGAIEEITHTIAGATGLAPGEFDRPPDGQLRPRRRHASLQCRVGTQVGRAR